MPDVTSTLLAMYQQIIGGSTSREQASCEAEAARRAILSGLKITPGGDVVLTGTLSVGSLFDNGVATIGGLLTVGSINCAGVASIGGLLTAASLSVTGAATVGADLAVTGTASMGAIACSGPASVNGILTVNGFGAHVVSAAGAGPNTLTVRNSAAGTGNVAGFRVGNDLSAAHTLLQVFASNFTTAGVNQADGATLVSTGAGGLTVGAIGAASTLRFYSGGGATERARFLSTGEFVVNGTATLQAAKVTVVGDAANSNGILVQNLNAGIVAMSFMVFANSGGATAGNIAGVTATTVAYNTASDARLKTDRGVASDLAALRGVVVHDFDWIGDGVRDRGVFAQEARAVFPRAVTVGTDEQTESGTLRHPWMTDYSKFVPDLIVGWQQHEDALRLLRAELQQLMQMTTYAKYQS